MEQQNIYSFLYDKFSVGDKPIYLIELFAGIGSQAKALERLGVNFKRHKVVEFDKYAIQSYNAIHNTDFTTLDIRDIHAKDLEIRERERVVYMMTYSFPCQDLSLAGKGKGMSKGGNTRSGLLWEVERLLNECGKELPQVLVMENVPQVIGKRNINDFKAWEYFLETKGYSNYCQLLNAKNYGIPQNRKRCFMVSILGDYSYNFPKRIPLKLKLKDMLEDNVNEKYYLSKKQINDIQYWNAYEKPLEIMERTDKQNISPTITTRTGAYTSSMILIKNATKQGYLKAVDGDGVDISTRMEGHRGTVQKGIIQTIKAQLDVGVVVKIGNYSPSGHNATSIVDNLGIAPTVMENHGSVTATNQGLKIRKLTPRECWRLMGFDDADYDKASKVVSESQLYKQAGNSIVVNVLEAIFRELL